MKYFTNIPKNSRTKTHIFGILHILWNFPGKVFPGSGFTPAGSNPDPVFWPRVHRGHDPGINLWPRPRRGHDPEKNFQPRPRRGFDPGKKFWPRPRRGHDPGIFFWPRPRRGHDPGNFFWPRPRRGFDPDNNMINPDLGGVLAATPVGSSHLTQFLL